MTNEVSYRVAPSLKALRSLSVRFFPFSETTPYSNGLLPCLVFVVQRHRLINGFLLSFLGAATKQNNQRFTIFGEVDAIPRPPVDFVLTNTTEPFDARGIA